jgi:predicted alpha/beta-fold hydrolase
VNTGPDKCSAAGAFRRAWWLPGAHLQTLYPTLFRRFRPPPLRRERIELPDGDFLDVDRGPCHDGPLVLLLHGLEGSIRSHYAAGLMTALDRCGFEGALMHFRGCSGEPNRLPRSYHSGETGDLATVLALLHARDPERPVFAIGVSLGGNVLLKWLGENPQQTLVQRAIAISVPFELNKAALRLQAGLSRLYQAHLLRKLRRSTRAKAVIISLPVPVDRLDQIRTFRSFDDRITAPLHGFAGVDDYYRRSSSRQFLKQIRTPTLILHALDDPFMTPDSVPGPDELGPGIQLELSEHGGHVGFIGGRWPWRACYWLDRRVCAWFRDISPHLDD